MLCCRCCRRPPTWPPLLTAPPARRQYEAEGHDLQSLLFNFLDELLFTFSTEFFVCKQLRVTSLDRERWRITAEGCAGGRHARDTCPSLRAPAGFQTNR